MKIKKLNLKENIIPNILYGSVILATISGSIIYYNYENKEQILNNEIDRKLNVTLMLMSI